MKQGSRWKKILMVLLTIIIILSISSFLLIKYTDIFDNLFRDSDISAAISAIVPVDPETEKVVFLIFGRDPADLTDALMLLCLDTGNKKAALLSIPRDTYVDIPGAGMDKINTAYNHGGEALVIKTVAELTGAGINHFVSLDYEGFVRIIDELGGVTVNVEKPFTDTKSGTDITFSAGEHHLNGERALSFVWSRDDKSQDIGRIYRQQQLLKALLDQKLNLRYLTKLPGFIEDLASTISTDLTIFEITEYLGEFQDMNVDDLNTIVLPSYPDKTDDGEKDIAVVDRDEARQIWQDIMAGSFPGQYNAEYISSQIPDSMVGGNTYTIEIEARNTGKTSWSGSGEHPISMTYNWIDSETSEIAVYEGGTFLLPVEEVKPGESVNFELDVAAPGENGKYILQIDLKQGGLTRFSYQNIPPLERFVNVGEKYGAEYSDSGSTPAEMFPGEEYVVRLEIKNTGSMSWNTGNDIDLGYRWIDRETNERIAPDDGGRLDINTAVDEGIKLVKHIIVAAPREQGEYILQYDLIDSDEGWFSEMGVFPLEVDVSIGSTDDSYIPGDIRILVLNGNGIAGSAGQLGDHLEGLGFVIADTDDAENYNHEKTIIYYKEDSAEKAQTVAGYLNSYELKGISIEIISKWYSVDYDIILVAGKDYRENL
jgi:LCP family protein required for cell wall assembly